LQDDESDSVSDKIDTSSPSSESDSDLPTGERHPRRRRTRSKKRRHHAKKPSRDSKRFKSDGDDDDDDKKKSQEERRQERREQKAEMLRKFEAELPEADRYTGSRCYLRPMSTDVLAFPTPLSHSAILEKRQLKQFRSLFRLPRNESPVDGSTLHNAGASEHLIFTLYLRVQSSTVQ
jgi:hypothetical protein